MTRTCLVISIALLTSLSARAQSYSLSNLKGMWALESQMSGMRSYVISDNMVMTRDLLKEENWQSSESMENFYLADEATDVFNDSKVGNSSAGGYIIKKCTGAFNGKVSVSKILTLTDTKLVFCFPGRGNGRLDTLFLSKVPCEVYDTLKMKSALTELSHKRSEANEKCFLMSFPATSYDFSRTFCKSLYPGKVSNGKASDMSAKASTYIKAFGSLRSVNQGEYINKMICVCSGLDPSAGNACKEWRETVTECLEGNVKAFIAALRGRSELQQVRFWQFLCAGSDAVGGLKQKLNTLCGNVTKADAASGKLMRSALADFGRRGDVAQGAVASSLRSVWDKKRQDAFGIITGRCYLSDNCLMYVSKTKPNTALQMKKVAPYYFSDSRDTKYDDSKTGTSNGRYVIIKSAVDGDSNASVFAEMQPEEMVTYDGAKLIRSKSCVASDTMRLSACLDEMRQNGNGSKNVQAMFLDAFPSSWTTFSAMFLSKEVGVHDFGHNAKEYIDAFAGLTISPDRRAEKAVAVTVDATGDGAVVQEWRKAVRDMMASDASVFKKALSKLQSWQRISFLQFVNNSASTKL